MYLPAILFLTRLASTGYVLLTPKGGRGVFRGEKSLPEDTAPRNLQLIDI